MEKLFIADDEKAIRDGIKCIIDWRALGFEIAGEAGNGDDALTGIMETQPSLVLMDIRMPGLTGLEVIEKTREQGFKGHYFILSGYSDFKYAQTAVKLGVRQYITKPIDDEELTKAVEDVLVSIREEREAATREKFFLSKSKKEILQDIIAGKTDYELLDAEALGIAASRYQIVVYENFDMDVEKLPYQFAEMFSVAGSSEPSKSSGRFEHFEYKHKNILLLCGSSSIDRFRRFLEHYDSEPQKGSPLDSLFIAYGCTVEHLSELEKSYAQAEKLIGRRFFCTEGQHVLGYEELPSLNTNLEPLDKNKIPDYSAEFIDYLQTFNRRKTAEILYGLEEYLYHVSSGISEVKLFMADLFLQIKDTMVHRYSAITLPFESNSDIIAFVTGRNYLYEVISYFSKQFEIIMNAIGNSSRDSVMDDILYYIDHNYYSNLKLEMIASLFGYNSSYLGKIFSKTVGESFNTYVDRVRVNHAIELLTEGTLKVYEIAEKVGYKNVDYFHKKFKKYVGISPAEYRKK